MSSPMILLEKDGILVQIEDTHGAQQISGGLAERVEKGLDQVRGVLEKMTATVGAYWATAESKVSLEKIEVEFGLSFEGEGNLFVSKAKAGANLGVTITMKRPAPARPAAPTDPAA